MLWPFVEENCACGSSRSSQYVQSAKTRKLCNDPSSRTGRHKQCAHCRVPSIGWHTWKRKKRTRPSHQCAHCRVEMTIKDSQSSGHTEMGQLKRGETLRGKVKRLEAFGAFVQVDNSTVTGLAHISEVSDDYVKSLQDVLQVGQGEPDLTLYAAEADGCCRRGMMIVSRFCKTPCTWV